MKIKRIVLILYMFLLMLPAKDVFAEQQASPDKSEVARIAFVKTDKAILFKGDGKVFAKDRLLPVVLYATNSEGSLMGLGVVVACPFVKLNPAILDFSEAGPGDYTIGFQESEAGTHLASVAVKDNDLFYINEEFLLKPQAKKKQPSLMDKFLSLFSSKSKEGPFIELLFYEDKERKKPLGEAAIGIKVMDKAGNVLDVDIEAGKRFIVAGVPRETLEVNIRNKKSGNSMLYKLFPQIRGTEAGFVEYDITLNNFANQ